MRKGGIDREGQQRLVVVPPAEGQRSGEARALGELQVACGAQCLQRVRRPERRPPAAWRRGRVGQVQRVVPRQGVVEVLEPGAGVSGPNHAALVRPGGADVHVVRPRVVGQRDLVVVREPEAGPPRQLTGMLRRREAAGDVDLGGRGRAGAHGADVPPFSKVELRGNRRIDVEVLRGLRVVGEHEYALPLRGEGRLGVDAVELGNLIPGSRRR